MVMTPRLGMLADSLMSTAVWGILKGRWTDVFQAMTKFSMKKKEIKILGWVTQRTLMSTATRIRPVKTNAIQDDQPPYAIVVRVPNFRSFHYVEHAHLHSPAASDILGPWPAARSLQSWHKRPSGNTGLPNVTECADAISVGQDQDHTHTHEVGHQHRLLHCDT